MDTVAFKERMSRGEVELLYDVNHQIYVLSFATLGRISSPFYIKFEDYLSFVPSHFKKLRMDGIPQNTLIAHYFEPIYWGLSYLVKPEHTQDESLIGFSGDLLHSFAAGTLQKEVDCGLTDMFEEGYWSRSASGCFKQILERVPSMYWSRYED